jgi:hypothetical protein
MKLMRLAQNVILARVAWSYIARHRQALARERRMRRIAPVLIAGGAGIVWAARPRILAGAHRVLDLMRRGLDGNAEARQQPDDAGVRKEPDTEAPVRERRSEVQRANTDQRPSEQGKLNGGGRARGASTASAETSAEPPRPSLKKRRKRARQKRAAQREKAERETAHGGAVKVEIKQPEDLRAPLGELKH